MQKWIVAGLAVLVVIWWIAAAPRAEIRIGEPLVIDSSTAKAIAAVETAFHSPAWSGGNPTSRAERLPFGRLWLVIGCEPIAHSLA
jgi:hypothetical protein